MKAWIWRLRGFEICWACKGIPSKPPYDPCMICKGSGRTKVDPSPLAMELSKWLRRAKDKLIDGFWLSALTLFALAEAAIAIVEFLLHVLRIPHWH